ncbi:MAG: N-acetylmuramoyl-L-alanine amidase-like domain-containing protein [Bacteroidota bacterium]
MRLSLLLLALLLTLGCRAEPDMASPTLAPVVAVADTLPPAPSTLPEDAAVEAATRATFRTLMAQATAEDWAALPMDTLVQTVGTALVGVPYVDGLLDADATETLVLNLSAFDCVLFVEHALALAQGLAVGDTTFAGFARRVEALRYRDGLRDGYASRLHYFSDWLRDNAARTQVTLLDPPGAEPYAKPIDFMTTHRTSYRKLAPEAPASDSLLAALQGVEAQLSAQPALAMLPQERIADAYPALRPGDVIATTTSIDGLDVTHTGFVVTTADGGTGFLHASSTGAVKVSPDLQAYIEGNAVQTGVLVARPVDPRTGS